MALIQPRTLRGFRDVLPERARHRMAMVRTLQDVFRAYGYGPIETPHLEYAEVLKGKGGEDTDKELFEFEDKGGRQVALRFDLTVPLARFVAQHQGKLVFPFRRSHIGTCFRGERPQRGRAREFLQCDADIIGPVSTAADAEILVLMLSAYEALGVGAVTLRINDRRVLNGILESLGVSVEPVVVLRAIDKREKQGDEKVAAELTAAGLSAEAAARLLAACQPLDNDEATLDALEAAVGTSEVGLAGVAALRTLRTLVQAAGKPESGLRVDPSIARGLDYYTGMVLEAQLDAMPEIGSVGSGGRYDDLAGIYTKARLPGVGCSIGVTRLLDAVEHLGLEDTTSGSADVLVIHPGDERLPKAFAFAAALRAEGFAVEIFPEAKKHGQQMRYADKQGIPHVMTLDAEGDVHGKRLGDGATADLKDARAAAAWMRSNTG